MSRYLGRLLEGVMAPCSGWGRLLLRPRPGLCRGLPGGGPHCHRPIRERPVLQNRGRTAAGLLQQFRSRLYPGGGGHRDLRQQPCGAAPLSGTYRRFPVRRPALPLLPARRGTPAGTTCGPQFQAASFPVAFTHSITGALSSTLNICAFVLFFTVVIRMLFLSGVMGALAGGAAALPLPWGWIRHGPSGSSPACWSSPPGSPPSPERAQ